MANFKFNKGDSVNVIRRNGEVVNGKVRSADYNFCTYKPQYEIDYLHNGTMYTMLCVPETAIELIH